MPEGAVPRMMGRFDRVTRSVLLAPVSGEIPVKVMVDTGLETGGTTGTPVPGLVPIGGSGVGNFEGGVTGRIPITGEATMPPPVEGGRE